MRQRCFWRRPPARSRARLRFSRHTRRRWPITHPAIGPRPPRGSASPMLPKRLANAPAPQPRATPRSETQRPPIADDPVPLHGDQQRPFVVGVDEGCEKPRRELDRHARRRVKLWEIWQERMHRPYAGDEATAVGCLPKNHSASTPLPRVVRALDDRIWKRCLSLKRVWCSEKDQGKDPHAC